MPPAFNLSQDQTLQLKTRLRLDHTVTADAASGALSYQTELMYIACFQAWARIDTQVLHGFATHTGAPTQITCLFVKELAEAALFFVAAVSGEAHSTYRERGVNTENRDGHHAAVSYEVIVDFDG